MPVSRNQTSINEAQKNAVRRPLTLPPIIVKTIDPLTGEEVIERLEWITTKGQSLFVRKDNKVLIEMYRNPPQPEAEEEEEERKGTSLFTGSPTPSPTLDTVDLPTASSAPVQGEEVEEMEEEDEPCGSLHVSGPFGLKYNFKCVPEEETYQADVAASRFHQSQPGPSHEETHTIYPGATTDTSDGRSALISAWSREVATTQGLAGSSKKVKKHADRKDTD